MNFRKYIRNFRATIDITPWIIIIKTHTEDKQMFFKKYEVLKDLRNIKRKISR